MPHSIKVYFLYSESLMPYSEIWVKKGPMLGTAEETEQEKGIREDLTDIFCSSGISCPSPEIRRICFHKKSKDSGKKEMQALMSTD